MHLRDARHLVTGLLIDESPRWMHVQGVGVLAERLLRLHAVTEVVACAAWLHDVGYAAPVRYWGFHPFDGARYLTEVGAPPGLVSLVAWHTGAETEARLRGLDDVMDAMPRPHGPELDVVTLFDLSVGPTGQPVTPEARLGEVLQRHLPDDVVHRARSADREVLLQTANRAQARLGEAWHVARALR